MLLFNVPLASFLCRLSGVLSQPFFFSENKPLFRHSLEMAGRNHGIRCTPRLARHGVRSLQSQKGYDGGRQPRRGRRYDHARAGEVLRVALQGRHRRFLRRAQRLGARPVPHLG